MRSLAAIFVLFTTGVSAQEHPYLSHFEAVPVFGEVVLHWTMVSGNTCSGIGILRGSTPGDLAIVGDIPGICGSVSEPLPYTWRDEHPPELGTLYYRLDLGTNGSSSVIKVEFDQLTTSDHRFFLSPGDGTNGLLMLRVPLSALVDVRVWGMDGRLVFNVTDEPGQEHPIRLPAGTSGVFVYEALTDSQHFTGRFVAY